jgi:DNA (cytosine-5)-methyltransferase 1
MKFGSVCSGIEAASVAWNPLGWEAAWFAEIEPAPSALLTHYYPHVENLGDMTKIADLVNSLLIEAPDMLCGGTPCQAFSVAGLRNSLNDARGNLSLTFCEIANAIDTTRLLWKQPPAIIFWENVPGVLSTKDNAFGCFLAGLAGEDDALIPPGGKWSNAGYVLGPKRAVAWRVLDAQYFGVAQRRRRVFVVASAREGFDPAAVLFEQEGLRRDFAPSRTQGKDITGPITAGISKGMRGTERVDSGWAIPLWPADVACTLDTHYGDKQGLENQHINGGGSLFVPVPYGRNGSEVRKARTAGGGFEGSVMTPAMQVRRLTPVECERLQGFPDNYTLVPNRGKPMADGPRYKALGNSWAVPVVRWIGERIKAAL